MKRYNIILLLIALLYAFLHIIQLEVYPFYHFGMYSEKRTMPEQLKTFEIILDGDTLDYKTLNYRRYVYITNTLREYDRIKRSNNTNPSSKIIQKYFQVLPFHSIKNKLLEHHTYVNLDAQMKSWLESTFPDVENIDVVSKTYSIQQGQKEFVEAKQILK